MLVLLAACDMFMGDPKVATTTISPDGKTFTGNQRVTLSSTPVDAVIYYTLDESEPTTSSILYSDPFTVSVTTTVKAIAIKKEFDPSGIATAIFIKEEDTTTPDKKYPYLPIKLKEFVVTDEDSALENPTPQDNKKSREISIEEKKHILEAIDLMRFVINTPEFKTEFFNDVYKFEAAEDDDSGIRIIKKGQYYDKNIVFNMLKNAAITTYIMKDDIGGDANALGTLGPHFYVNVDAKNPIIEGDNDDDDWVPLDLLIILPNTFYWTDTNSIYGDKYRLAQIIFHELIHNLGFNHLNNSPNEIWNQYDTANFMEDIFRSVITNAGWKNKYKTELEQYSYYRTEYANFLGSKTVPK